MAQITVTVDSISSILLHLKDTCKQDWTPAKSVEYDHLCEIVGITQSFGKDIIDYLVIKGHLNIKRGGPKGTYWRVNIFDHNTVAKAFFNDVKNGTAFKPEPKVKDTYSKKPDQFKLGEKVYFVSGDRIRIDKIKAMHLTEDNKIQYTMTSNPIRSHEEVFPDLDGVINFLKQHIAGI